MTKTVQRSVKRQKPNVGEELGAAFSERRDGVLNTPASVVFSGEQFFTATLTIKFCARDEI